MIARVTAVALLLALATSAGAAGRAPAEPPPKRAAGRVRVALMDVTLTGREAATLDSAALTELLAGAVEDPANFQITTARDVVAMLGLEKMKQMAGCSEDASCLAEIAGALGVEYLVAASVGSLEGGRLVVAGRLVDAKRAAVLVRASDTVTSRAAVADAVVRVGARLKNGFRGIRGLEPAPVASSSADAARGAEPAGEGSGFAGTWGFGLAAASAPTEPVVGGEAQVTLGTGAWEWGLGATIAERPAARFSATRAIVGERLSLRLGLRGLVGPTDGGVVAGGGAVGTLRIRLSRRLDGDLSVAGEYLSAPGGGSLVPIVGVGVHLRL